MFSSLQGDGDTPASVTSQTLENVYLADRDTEIPFGAGAHQYVLHFKGEPGMQMYQENLKYKTKREVRRRPHFVSALDVKVKLERYNPFLFGTYILHHHCHSNTAGLDISVPQVYLCPLL